MYSLPLTPSHFEIYLSVSLQAVNTKLCLRRWMDLACIFTTLGLSLRFHWLPSIWTASKSDNIIRKQDIECAVQHLQQQMRRMFSRGGAEALVVISCAGEALKGCSFCRLTVASGDFCTSHKYLCWLVSSFLFQLCVLVYVCALPCTQSPPCTGWCSCLFAVELSESQLVLLFKSSYAHLTFPEIHFLLLSR